jgi:hypothetical protein
MVWRAYCWCFLYCQYPVWQSASLLLSSVSLQDPLQVIHMRPDSAQSSCLIRRACEQVRRAAGGAGGRDADNHGAVPAADHRQQPGAPAPAQLAPHDRARAEAVAAHAVRLDHHVLLPLPPLAQHPRRAHLLWRPRVLQGALQGCLMLYHHRCDQCLRNARAQAKEYSPALDATLVLSEYIAWRSHMHCPDVRSVIVRKLHALVSAGRYAALARLLLHASMSAQAWVLQLDLDHMDTP